jgi:D-3-phosphoglycerate dehydrogenase
MAKQVLTLNQISAKGLDRFPRDTYDVANEISQPDAILLRSYKLQEEQIPKTVLAIGRAGAGVNNIPVAACTARGIPVFNSPGANANAVKELVATGLLLGSRGVVEGIEYVDTLGDMKDAGELNKTLEDKRNSSREVSWLVKHWA